MYSRVSTRSQLPVVRAHVDLLRPPRNPVPLERSSRDWNVPTNLRALIATSSRTQVQHPHGHHRPWESQVKPQVQLGRRVIDSAFSPTLRSCPTTSSFSVQPVCKAADTTTTPAAGGGYGFTRKYIAEYLSSHPQRSGSTPLTFAIAGRSQEKLNKVKRAQARSRSWDSHRKRW